ncbi:ABC transporter ATP-binding protein [Nocardiopsis valliformis]|uniref:ABC transporter ATP-binding protein n=1 Tax=Nocardiopsis valliformis TaxID=239974 RepID=UPI00034A6DCE|nr:ABC transporter ATP-binding protein [Nocardiopsis valliformis]
MSTHAIEVRGLDKYFGAFKALDGLDLTVETGQVAGFLGPNGSGKSTTIRVLLGLLKADGGTARVLGGDPWKDAVALHRRLAYVPGDVALWPNLTGGQAIDLLGRLHGTVNPSRRKELLNRFELDPSKKARTYSKGNRQKVALVAALASDAELLILDEPTSGLDPLMESVFTECVQEVKEQGRSVLLSSHILAEVEKLCDTVTIIRKGVTVESGTLDEMRHLTRSTVRATVGGDATVLAGQTGVHGLAVDGGTVTFEVDDIHLDQAMRTLSGLGLRSLVSNPPSLEDLFMRHYGDELASLNGDRDGAA